MSDRRPMSGQMQGADRGSAEAYESTPHKRPTEVTQQMAAQRPPAKEDDLQRLKDELGTQLTSTARLKRPGGIPTGFQELDRFLLWNGFPKGGLTALTGHLGLGGTSLWVEAAAHVTRQGRWAAWVDREAQLFPLTLWQKELDLSRLVTIEAPETEKKLLWLLQELMASTLFEVIGCDLGQVKLRDHQLRKLQTQARAFNTALVFFAGRERFWNVSLFSLIVDFRPREISVERALHRPTPFRIPRRITYANFFSHGRPNADLEDSSRPDGAAGPASVLSEYLEGLEPSALPDPAAVDRRTKAPRSSASGGGRPAERRRDDPSFD